MNLTSAPPLPVIPEEWHGRKVVALVAASTGPAEEGGELVRALRAGAEPIADLLGPMPYRVLQSLLDPLWAKGIHSYFKATNRGALRRRADRPPVQDPPGGTRPQCEIHVQQMGGAIARVAEGASVFPDRGMPFVLNAVTGWHDPAAGPGPHRLGASGDPRPRRRRRPDAPTSTSWVTRTPRAPPTARRRTSAWSR